ncbi:MAG: glycerol-3-phosphate 1-O-acyltransferase PlsY [Myxococcota bacterium]
MAYVGPSLALAAYLLGSLCFGIIIAARHGVDLRNTGSGNVGATNVGRALGKPVGRWVLLLDALKGFAPALAAHLLLGPQNLWTAITAFLACFGHCYPIWFRFKGGKAAATAVGVLLAVVPWAGLAAAVMYVLLKKLTKRASVGSLGGGAAALGVTAALYGVRATVTAMAGAIFLLLVWRHRDNLQRLIRGEEPPS